jgi:hypothetical protein
MRSHTCRTGAGGRIASTEHHRLQADTGSTHDPDADLSATSLRLLAARHVALADEAAKTDSAKDWSVMDVEDLRDYAKVMTLDELAAVLVRRRHEIQRKLIELGLSTVRRCSWCSILRA